MLLNNIFIFFVSLFLVIKGATLSTKYSERLAEGFSLSKYIVGFIVISIISILPETFISINAALEGIPSFGLGMLFGSNIADLTLLFAIIIFFANRGLKVESQILKNHVVYPFLLLLPLVLGLDGYFSRLEGAALIIAGVGFYYFTIKNGRRGRAAKKSDEPRWKSVAWLSVSMGLLLVGSHFTVTSATVLAYALNVSPILIGMLVVGLGTTMPELFFSLKSVKKRDDSLAIGDILGTVLADATIVVGLLAIINPFSFPQKIIYITGVFMVVAACVLFYFLRTKRTLSKMESYFLFLFWLVFVFVEFIVNT